MKINRRAVKNICHIFAKSGIPYTLENFEDILDIIHVPFSTQDGKTLSADYYTERPNRGGCIRIADIAHMNSEDQRYDVLNALNKLNCNSPQLKFCLDANNAVYAEYIFPNRTPDILIGWIALEMQGVIQRALDEAYPRIQNAVLGLSNTEDSHIHITEEQIKEYKRLYLEAKKSRITSKHKKHRRDGEENGEPLIHRWI